MQKVVLGVLLTNQQANFLANLLRPENIRIFVDGKLLEFLQKLRLKHLIFSRIVR